MSDSRTFSTTIKHVTACNYDTAVSPPGGYDDRGDRPLNNRLIQAEQIPGGDRYRLAVRYELPGEFDASEVEIILARTEKWRFSTEAIGELAVIVNQAIAYIHQRRTAV